MSCPEPRRKSVGLYRKLRLLKGNVHTHIHTRMNAMMIRYVWEKKQVSSFLLLPYPVTNSLPDTHTHTHAALQTGTPTSTAAPFFTLFSVFHLSVTPWVTLWPFHQFFTSEKSRRVCEEDSLIKVQKEQISRQAFQRSVGDKRDKRDGGWCCVWWISQHRCQAAVTVKHSSRL